MPEKPKFDPNAEYEVVEDEKPPFNPDAHYEAADEPEVKKKQSKKLSIGSDTVLPYMEESAPSNFSASTSKSGVGKVKASDVKSITDFNKKYGTSYSTLEEFTTQLPDQQTVDFFDRVKAENGPDWQAALLTLQKKYGNPRVTDSEESPIPGQGNAPAAYNPLTNRIHINMDNYEESDKGTRLENVLSRYIAELPHSIQKQSKDSFYDKFLNDLVAYASLRDPYKTKGTLENEAHSVIEPQLVKEFQALAGKKRQHFESGSPKTSTSTLRSESESAGDRSHPDIPAPQTGEPVTTIVLPKQGRAQRYQKALDINVQKAEQTRSQIEQLNQAGQLTEDQYADLIGQYTESLDKANYFEKALQGQHKLESMGHEDKNRFVDVGLKELGAMINNSAAGMARLYGKAHPEALANTAAIEEWSARKANAQQDKAQYYREILDEAAGYAGKDMSKIYDEKGLLGAIEYGAKKFTESAPITAYITGMSMVGLAPIANTQLFTGTTYDKYRELEGRTDMSEEAKLANAVGYGTTELLFEGVLTTGVASLAKDYIKRFGKERAKEELKKTILGTMRQGLKKVAPLTEMGLESLGEGATQLSQNLIDKYTDPEKADIDPLQGVLDAAAIGAIGGSGFAAGTLGGAIVNKYANKTKLEKLQAEKEALEKTSAQVSPETAEILNEDAAKVQEKQNEIILKDRVVLSDKMTEEAREEVKVLSNDIETLKAEMANVDEAGQEILQSKIDAKQKQIDSFYKEAEKENEVGDNTGVQDEGESVKTGPEGLKNQLVKAGKVVLDKKGKVEDVKQNSGASSQLFKDLTEIVGDKEQALGEYLRIKDDEGDFKNKFADWENKIMRDYGRSGKEYAVVPDDTAPAEHKNDFAWYDDARGKPTIHFNKERLSRDIPFKEQKKGFIRDVIDPEIEEYRAAGNTEAVAKMEEYKKLFEENMNSNRDIKMHLIHDMLYGEMNAGREVTPQDIEDNYIRSVKEMTRLDQVKLAKDYFGEPMIYMHGGAEGIKNFKKPSDKGHQKNDPLTGEEGIYFTRDLNELDKRPGFRKQEPGEGQDIYYTFLKYKNPYYLEDAQAQAEYPLTKEQAQTLTTKTRKDLEALGYDAIIVSPMSNPKQEIIVFEPDQVEIIGTYKKGLTNKQESKLNGDDKLLSGTKVNQSQENDGAKSVFESSAELKKIGTPEQYSQYLKTVFPDTKIKDVIYHGTKNEFEEFDKSFFGTNSGVDYYGKGFYFSKEPLVAKSWSKGGRVIAVLVNVKNPYAVDSKELGKDFVLPEGYDGVEQDKYGEVMVPEPDQIHTLGSKKDIEGFRAYVKNISPDQLTEKNNDGKSKEEKEKNVLSDESAGVSGDSPADFTPEELEAEEKRAKDEGFTSLKHKINAINSSAGTDYARIQDIPEEVVKEVVKERSEMVGISQAENARTRSMLEMDDYEGLPTETHKNLLERAKKVIQDGFDIDALMTKLRNGQPATNLENAILAEYKSSLEAAIEKNPSKDLIDKLSEFVIVKDPAGSILGKALESLKLLTFKEDNLANFLVEKMDAAGVTELSAKQIEEQTKLYTELKEAKEKYEQAIKDLQAKHSEEKATENVRKVKSGSKKSHEEYVKERKEYVNEARERLKKLRGTMSAAGVPYVRELIEVAPIVAKMVKSYKSEGIEKLDAIVSAIHEELKELIDGITKSDVRDIIAGEYTEKKTRNEMAAEVLDLKREAQLLKQIEDARLFKPKTETGKNAQNRRLQELHEKLAEIQRRNKDSEPVDIKSNEEKLKVKRKSITARIEDLQGKIKRGEHLTEAEKPKPIKFDRKTILLQDRLDQLQRKVALDRERDRYEKTSKAYKLYDKVMRIFGLRRLIQTSIDLSMPGRQMARVTMNPLHIDVTKKSLEAMFKNVFSEQNFRRMMFAIRNSEFYHEMTKDGIVFNEMDALNTDEQNEEFQRSYLFNIPYLREPFLASNRAADSALNVARFELYMKKRMAMERAGLTRENSPEAYKELAKWVMNLTGRGKALQMIERSPEAKKIFGNTFYGTRLMAASFNTLNPWTYTNPAIPKEVRIDRMKDMLGYTSTFVALALVFTALGFKVGLDPDEADFLKFRKGDKRYDLTGGLATYIRTFLRIVKAAALSANPTVSEEDKIKAGNFAGKSTVTMFRNKLAPNTSYGVDFIMRKNAIGKPFDPLEALKLYPLYVDDIMKAWPEEGATSLLTTVLPSVFGIGVMQYGEKDKTPNDNASAIPPTMLRGKPVPKNPRLENRK